MFTSPSSVETGATLKFDICIVGGGAAGITLALELEASGRRVCLLEAGGFDPPALDSDHPYVGESVGRPYDLLMTRLRFFGGTTDHWGGWCRPFDDVDFQARSYVPLRGWPISQAELDPYYRRAAKICEIEPSEFEVDRLPADENQRVQVFDSHAPDLLTKNFRFSPPTRSYEYVTFDAFLSLLLDFRYGPNYDISQPEDRDVAEGIIHKDIECIRSGRLKPTAMFGIFQ
jgi:choline dehydrogenase-like flavoprotein